jgi:hypothetical protein
VVFDWHKYFREGNTSITDKEGRERKKKVTTTLVTLVANRRSGQVFRLSTSWLMRLRTHQRRRNEVAVMGFGRVAHPPYSPVLAPFDFAIFPAIKSVERAAR